MTLNHPLRIPTELLTQNLTLWASLTTYALQGRMQSMIGDPGGQMGTQRCVLPSVQSITVSSWATYCNGARTRLKLALRTSALVCGWASLTQADSHINFDGTTSNAITRIGILAGLLLVLKSKFPIIICTGQAILSPEKLVKCVWLDNPIMGMTVDPAGQAFYQGTE